MGRLIAALLLFAVAVAAPGCVIVVTNNATGEQFLCSSDLPPTDPCVPILPGGNFKPAPRP